MKKSDDQDERDRRARGPSGSARCRRVGFGPGPAVAAAAVAVARRAARARSGGWTVGTLPLAPAAVDAVRLLFAGPHPAAYGSRAPWSSRASSASTSAGRRSSPALVDARRARVERRIASADDHVGSQEELLARSTRSVEALHATSDVAALGFGIPSRIDQRHGRRSRLGEHPARRASTSATGMRERFGLPVAIDNDANAAALAEWQVGAGRGARDMRHAHARHRRRRRRCPRRQALSRALGASSATSWSRSDGLPCQGCDGRGHLEPYATGVAADAGRARAASAPAPTRTELVRRRRRGRRAGASRRSPRSAASSAPGSRLSSTSSSRSSSSSAAASARPGELLLGPAREVVAREALDAGAATTVRIVRGRARRRWRA